MLVAPGRAGSRLAVMVSLATVAWLAVLLGPASAAEPTTPAATPLTPEERAAAIAAPAVVLLEIHWEGWVRNRSTGVRWDERILTVTTRCSGFTVSNDGYVVTASHCVDSGRNGVAPAFLDALVRRQVDEGALPPDHAPVVVQDMLANGVLEGPRQGEPLNRRVYVQRSPATPGSTTGEATEARVVTLHPAGSGDVALLKVDRSNQPIVRLGDADARAAAERVLVLGYPSTAVDSAEEPVTVAVESGTVTPGPTASPTSAGAEVEPPPLYLASAGLTPAMEGGPVVDLNGDVVGVLTLDSAATPAATKVMADAAALADDFDSNDVSNDLGRIDNDYRDGLDAYVEGRYDDCIRHFDDVLAALPSHQQAQDLRQKAVTLRELDRENPPEQPEDRRSMILGGSLLAVLILAAATVTGLFWRHRRAAP